ncbi:MAG: hypothetical protein AAF604_22450 [Acidobacteriota bacterium]
MIRVSRGDLQGEYIWTAVGTGASKIEETQFNRKQGYEVLAMVQKMVSHFGIDSQEDVRKVEAAIVEIPEGISDRIEAFAWLVENLPEE